MNKLTCFKSYDIRGKLGLELNEDVAYRIGRAFAQHLNAKKIVIGYDARETSPILKNAVAQGILDSGSDVIDIGLSGTEEIYFAAFHLDVDGGIEITASHNPIDYNGMKFVGHGAMPISSNTGLNEIKKLAEQANFNPSLKKGTLTECSILSNYINHILGYINLKEIKPLKLVVNAGNGAAGHVIDALEETFKKMNVPLTFIKVNHDADHSFPNGIPNPLLPENRTATSAAVKKYRADMGIAWDGDFDRCFLFDENGQFIEGYYIVGLLAEAFLRQNPGEKIIHDPRLVWNTREMIIANGGEPVQSKTGHAFIKERMRSENAIYGGEMSAHHYFRDFAYCDSGMIPWLLVAQLLSQRRKSLSELVGERMQAYPCSGEINYKVKDSTAIIDRIRNYFSSQAPEIDMTDGISLTFSEWRMNLRASNTEPLLRLNIETRADTALLHTKVAEVEALIEGHV
ncbi:phosphomannomutase CpsG [Chromobacterium violaceum]|uniref:phosphomannomutase CpsG n=1 Tax=Chromobacterium violaceum TaxID=536 RepID=UPI001B31B389|nr:phosphomannomutase CpsG [Chromobacterium violaceum]MBP4044677.1 phosphomannomutase CpsG [Chromobacterium violaceum]